MISPEAIFLTRWVESVLDTKSPRTSRDTFTLAAACSLSWRGIPTPQTFNCFARCIFAHSTLQCARVVQVRIPSRTLIAPCEQSSVELSVKGGRTLIFHRSGKPLSLLWRNPERKRFEKIPQRMRLGDSFSRCRAMGSSRIGTTLGLRCADDGCALAGSAQPAGH